MAYPFGGHPTFAEYLRWAREQGCSVQTGVVQAGVHRSQGVTRIGSPNGRLWVIEAGTEQTEILLPTSIARLDRRLGLKSPWFSIDDEN